MPTSLLRLFAATALVSLFVVCQATSTLAGTTATINGTVTDNAGHPISGVSVSIVAPSYQIKTTTGANGFYVATGLPPDTYTLTFSLEGYITQTVPGITLNQDQTYVQSIVLQHEVKTIGRIPVRGSTSLVQPTVTVNQYTVNAQSVQNITGTPQNISETAVLNALPGITTDSGGYPIIRGGAENDEGFELEGIDATEPITGQFINSLALNGVARLQLSTGGYDVSEGNTNSGVVNVIAKRGVFPGGGQATSRVGYHAFDHRLSYDYGGATADNRFSYYVSFNGARSNEIVGDGTTFYPRAQGGVDYESSDDYIVNLFYHFGANSQNELQYFADAGANLFNLNYEIDPATTPYATNNCVVIVITGGPCPSQGSFPSIGPSGFFSDPNAALVDFAPLFPGQVGLHQNTNYPDHEDENHQIQKINFKHQFNPQSFAELRVFRTQSTVNFLIPWDEGAFLDIFEYDVSDNKGIAFDYSNQISSQHEISVGAEALFTKPTFSIAIPSAALFTDPLECGAACFFLGLTGTFNPNTPLGFTYVQPLYNQLAGPFGLAPATVPLTQLPADTSYVTDDTHRNYAWIKDRWQPSSRWTLTAGARWDEEVIDLPSNIGTQNLIYIQNAVGNFIDIPSPAVGSDVTRPSTVSPRLALSYQAGTRDVFKASYGRFIEFTPLSNIENTYKVESSAAGCTIANSCFTPLPGFSPTCVNGVDSLTHALCNGISNLNQQTIEDLNRTSSPSTRRCVRSRQRASTSRGSTISATACS